MASTPIFRIPKSNGLLKVNRFEYAIGDATYSIPKLQYLTGDMVTLLHEIETQQEAGIASIDLMYQVFGTDDPAAAKAVKTLDVEQINALFVGWTEASNVTPEKSIAS